jgi:hypothetical protein
LAIGVVAAKNVVAWSGEADQCIYRYYALPLRANHQRIDFGFEYAQFRL